MQQRRHQWHHLKTSNNDFIEQDLLYSKLQMLISRRNNVTYYYSNLKKGSNALQS